MLIIHCITFISYFFFINDTSTTEIYTLSLHDALPICTSGPPAPRRCTAGSDRSDTPGTARSRRKAAHRPLRTPPRTSVAQSGRRGQPWTRTATSRGNPFWSCLRRILFRRYDVSACRREATGLSAIRHSPRVNSLILQRGTGIAPAVPLVPLLAPMPQLAHAVDAWLARHLREVRSEQAL